MSFFYQVKAVSNDRNQSYILICIVPLIVIISLHFEFVKLDKNRLSIVNNVHIVLFPDFSTVNSYIICLLNFDCD